MIVMTEVLDKSVEEVSQDVMWELLLPDNFPQARDAYLGLQTCDKCGRIDMVFKQSYIEEVEKKVCFDCDEKLFDILDKLPIGVPETNYERDTMYYSIARLIVESFFS